MDRQTDRQTDGQNYNSQDRPRICSRGKNGVKALNKPKVVAINPSDKHKIIGNNSQISRSYSFTAVTVGLLNVHPQSCFNVVTYYSLFTVHRSE